LILRVPIHVLMKGRRETTGICISFFRFLVNVDADHATAFQGIGLDGEVEGDEIGERRSGRRMWRRRGSLEVSS
jgi:hypothetical protein